VRRNLTCINTCRRLLDWNSRIRADGGDMDWLLYAVLMIALIIVGMRLSAWLLFRNRGNRD
jgi:hypothetical protein